MTVEKISNGWLKTEHHDRGGVYETTKTHSKEKPPEAISRDLRTIVEKGPREAPNPGEGLAGAMRHLGDY